MDWKADLYEKVAPHLGDARDLRQQHLGPVDQQTVRSVSGGAAAALLRRAFLQSAALHAPGRADRRAADTDAAILDDLEKFLVTTLGKGVIRAKDTPNFIANRVGVFSMLATMHHAERLGLGFDVVDALTGTLIGRPSSATFRTADVVGLDTFAHVVNTMKRHAAGRSVAPVLRRAGLAEAADRAGRAGAEDAARASTRRSARTSTCSI